MRVDLERRFWDKFDSESHETQWADKASALRSESR